MYINKVTVKNYRSIKDTSLNILERQITCLIGGNGSGKSNILKAIAALKDDLLLTEDTRHIGALDSEPVEISATFIFADEDKADLEDYGLSMSAISGFTVTRTKPKGAEPILTIDPVGYSGILETRLNKDVRELVSDIVATLSEEDKSAIQADLDILLDTDRASEERVSSLGVLKAKVDENEQLKEQFDTHIDTMLAELSNDVVDVLAELFDGIDIELLSFDQYLVEDEAPLSELTTRDQHPMLSDLLTISGKTAADFEQAQRNNRVNISEAASDQIQSEIKKVWPTNELKVIINKDQGDQFLSFCARTRQNKAVLLKDLSDGEQWFLRFYTRLATAKMSKKKVIWLFDEPDRGLHAKSQIDLRQFIGDVSTESQIMYATHQPNMIQWHKLERIFVVENMEINGKSESGTIVHKRFWKDNEFKSPLREVLRLFIGDEVLWGDEHVIVEGPSDYFLLTGWLNFLNRSRDAIVWKESYIAPSRTFIPVSGANNIPYFLFFLTRESAKDVNWFTLVDSGDDYKEVMAIMGKGRLKSFKDKVATILELLPSPKFDKTSIPAGTEPKFDIEDLFEPEDYYREFSEHYSREYPDVKLPALKSLDSKKFQIAKQIETKVKELNEDLGNKYTLDKTGVAQSIYLKLATEKKSAFSKNSEDNFADLLKEINKRFTPKET